MSAFIHTPCACGVEIISVSSDEDDVRIAVASHNEIPRHQEWRAVNSLKRLPRRKCPCTGSVTNSPHTPQEGMLAPAAAPRPLRPDLASINPRVKVGLS